jgi:hypothetical protein
VDNAVALVQSYLRVNGYFTVAEYPVVEAARGAGYRQATDLDILAIRFAGAGRLLAAGRGGGAQRHRFEPDEALGIAAGDSDMVIGEVKEGPAVLNRAAADPIVLRAALSRFGCCSEEDASGLVEALLRSGETRLPTGHRLRLVAFGGSPPEGRVRAARVILLRRVVEFLRRYLAEHWEVLRHAQFKEPGLAFLTTVEKAVRG